MSRGNIADTVVCLVCSALLLWGIRAYWKNRL